MKLKFLTSIILASALTLPMVSYAYNACQCVGYIKNRVGDQSSAGNAHEMDGYLQKNGYYRINLNQDMPRNKDIVIIRTNYGRGYNSTYGHVGIVSSASGQAGSTIYVDLVSANMNDTAFTQRRKPNAKYPERSEWGCDNVSGNILTISPNDYSKVAVYRR